MATSEAFTIIEDDGSHPPRLFDDYQKGTSGKMTDLDVQLVTALREKHPDLIVTSVPSLNCKLLQFAAAGFATADVDEDSEPVLRWRGFVGPSHRGGSGFLADNIFFAKYHYKWNNEDFILYTVRIGYGSVQYVLKEPRGNETPSSHSIVTDALLTSIGAWLIKEVPAIYVFDGYWARSTKLWEEVEKASWDDVILDPKMKKALTEETSKDIYDEYGVPWKRGLIFRGPVGNGKTISLASSESVCSRGSDIGVTVRVLRLIVRPPTAALKHSQALSPATPRSSRLGVDICQSPYGPLARSWQLYG